MLNALSENLHHFKIHVSYPNENVNNVINGKKLNNFDMKY